MSYRDRTVRVLVGNDSTVSGLAVGLSVFLGLFLWVFYPESGIQWSLLSPVLFLVVTLSVGLLAASVALDKTPPVSIVATAVTAFVGLYLYLFVHVTGGRYLVSLFSVVDWLLFLSFTLLAAGIAFGHGGLLAACWVNFPAQVAIAYHFYNHQSGSFVIFPVSKTLAIVSIAGVTAVLLGTFGYAVARFTEQLWPRVRTSKSVRSALTD